RGAGQDQRDGTGDAGDREHRGAVVGAEDVVDAGEQRGDQQQRDQHDADHELAVDQALAAAASRRRHVRRVRCEGRTGHQISWGKASGPTGGCSPGPGPTRRTAGRTERVLPAVRRSAVAAVAQALASSASASVVRYSVYVWIDSFVYVSAGMSITLA